MQSSRGLRAQSSRILPAPSTFIARFFQHAPVRAHACVHRAVRSGLCVGIFVVAAEHNIFLDRRPGRGDGFPRVHAAGSGEPRRERRNFYANVRACARLLPVSVLAYQRAVHAQQRLPRERARLELQQPLLSEYVRASVVRHGPQKCGLQDVLCGKICESARARGRPRCASFSACSTHRPRPRRCVAQSAS